jgi:hypothetical protein
VNWWRVWGSRLSAEMYLILERMLRRLIADDHVREAARPAAKQRIREQHLGPKIATEIEHLARAGFEPSRLFNYNQAVFVESALNSCDPGGRLEVAALRGAP